MSGYMSSHLSSVTDKSFTEVAPGVGSGNAPDATWQPLANVPLVILVGVTGVGKSTTLQNLRQNGLSFQLLPDRRELTDQLIIAFLQRQAGETPHPITDRMERFAFTRRYREQFPGGMSHALSRLLVLDDHSSQPLGSDRGEEATATAWHFFDGLRGAEEVQAAADLLPAARFILLDAPDAVRVERLLGRGDHFDRVALQPVADFSKRATEDFAAIGMPEADALFNSQERARLLARCLPPIGQGDLPVDNLRAKLKIVTEERRNYDPSAALQTLQRIAPQRTLLIDTTKLNAAAAAEHIGNWLQQ